MYELWHQGTVWVVLHVLVNIEGVGLLGKIVGAYDFPRLCLRILSVPESL